MLLVLFTVLNECLISFRLGVSVCVLCVRCMVYRSCTDVICLILFVVLFTAFIVIGGWGKCWFAICNIFFCLYIDSIVSFRLTFVCVLILIICNLVIVVVTEN